ncbi:MAG: hypothetical protein WD048_11015 [Chitinophagales bacterium]
MKTLILNVFMVFFSCMLLAQDNIIYVDGTEESAKVLEVNDREIKYRISEGEEPAIFTVPRSQVFMIQFADGQSKVITATQRPRVPGRTVDRETMADAAQERSDYHEKGKRLPILAFTMSWFLPGAGQYYNGDVAKGVVMSGLWVAGGSTVIGTLIASSRNDNEPCTIDRFGNSNCPGTGDRFTQRQKVAMGIGAGAAFGSFLWSVIDAPVVAAVRNRKIDRESKDGSASRQLIWDISPGAAAGPGASFTLKF